jgi:hypothetical protein
MSYPSITIQGNIVSSETLDKIREEGIKFQNAGDFGLDRRTTVRDEIGMAWASARAFWTAFQIRAERLKEGESGASETRNLWMIPLLRELGYDVEKAPAFTHPDSLKTYAISHRANNLKGFPIHIMGINDDLDRRRESSGPRLSPHALTQEYLNNTDHTYALVTNGTSLRLLRDATRLVKLSFLEFDLRKMMEEDLYTDFALLFRLLHASRMPKDPESSEESSIEFYHQESLASGSRIREKLSQAVEQSIKLLANGFLHQADNEHLRRLVTGKHVEASAYYLFQLRLIYRFLFLIVTEERNLVYPDSKSEDLQRKRKIYYDFFSMERLRKLAGKLHFVDGRKYDLWEGIKTTFRLFENDAVGKKLGISPLGSGLFSPDALGPVANAKLDNESLLHVIRLLTFFQNEQGNYTRVNYSDLDVEEFGSVYEGLLEYDAVINEIAGQPTFAFVAGKSRSSSGSHYTPEELVRPLIKHSLDYLIEDRLKEADPEAALLRLKVADVACGSGHILLSAARRIAFELACLRETKASNGKEKVEQPSPKFIRAALRDVIKNCIYGVDKNPLAVELCKVALWLEAHNPGEPLNFLDHHIKCGDAIVGLAHRNELERGIADEAFKTLPGDEPELAATFRNRNKAERKEREANSTQLKAKFEVETENVLAEAQEEYQTFQKMPEATPAEIERKARAYQQFLGGKGFLFLKAMADAQVAQFFIPKTLANKDYLLTDRDYRQMMEGHLGWQNQKLAKATAVASEGRFFHWFLEFPEVFNRGGFDCVLGNPPFLGGSKISTHYSLSFYEFLGFNFKPAKGRCDLVGYFFNRIYGLLSKDGFSSLIATNTISQGDTREGSLVMILESKGSINHAIKSINWPGQAAVKISLVTFTKNVWEGRFMLDRKEVEGINSFLIESAGEDINTLDPKELLMNSSLAFQGTVVLGKGFLIEPKLAKNIIDQNKKNEEVLLPYLTGKELYDNYDQIPERVAINFRDWNENYCSENYPESFKIVSEKVKPERVKVNRARYRDYWWQFGEKCENLYRNIAQNLKVLVKARVSKTFAFAFVEPGYIYPDALIVFSFRDYFQFSSLQSSLHEIWAWQYCSRMKDDMSYGPSRVFETFPFPKAISKKLALENIGEDYHCHRGKLMMDIQLGLTKIYNAFHGKEVLPNLLSSTLQSLDKKAIEKQFGKEVWNLWNHLQKTPGNCNLEEAIEGIVRLRALHVQMDQAVLEAYGWQDVALRHDFYEVDYLPENDRVRYTIHPDARKEILKRLLELNHKIHEEEVKAGLWDKKKGGTGEKNKVKKKSDLENPTIEYGGEDEPPIVASEQPINSYPQNEIKEGAVITLISHDNKEIRISLGKSISSAMSISADSPFGQALLGRKTGDYISFGKGFKVVAIE